MLEQENDDSTIRAIRYEEQSLESTSKWKRLRGYVYESGANGGVRAVFAILRVLQ